MNIDNINKIMESSLWSKILDNKEYRGYKIIDTKRLVHRSSGQFFVLLVFFETENGNKLRGYLDEGRTIGSDREGLDPTKIYSFYGTMKMLRFS